MHIPSFELHTLVLVGLATIIGYYLGLAIRRTNLPSLLGYMILGVILGVSGLNLLSEHILERLEFISELTLAVVAFNIGSELSIATLRKLGLGIVVIILSESFLAFATVATAVGLLTRDLPMALVFGAMAPASAPAGTVHVIQETKAKGTLTKALYAVVGFDDGLAIVIYGFAAAIARNLLIGETSGVEMNLAAAMMEPLAEIVFSILTGALLGFVFSLLVHFLTQERDSFILVFGFVCLASGLALMFNLSLIMTSLVMGFVFVNTRKEAIVQGVLRRTQSNTPYLYILFFCLAGAHLNLASLPTLGLIGVAYILGRSCGLIGGARIGAILGRAEPKIRKYLGLGILSQAGVAIGLSLILRQELSELGTPHALKIGTAVLTTITATSIFFEIIGPIMTRFALSKAGEIPPERSAGSR